MPAHTVCVPSCFLSPLAQVVEEDPTGPRLSPFLLPSPSCFLSSAAQVVEEDPLVAAIHNHAEVFDPKAEFVFSYLQVRGVDSVKMMDCSLGAGWLGRSGP